MSVAVLIPAHNEEVSIEDTLRSALKQGHSVFVVDDASTDATATLSRPLAETYTVPENVGKGVAIALGIRWFRLTERFDFVFLMDADTRIDPGHIDALVDAAEEGDAILIGRLRSDWERNRTIWGRYRDYALDVFSWTMKRSTDIFRLVNVLPGVAMLFRSEALAKVDMSRAARYPVEDLVMLIEVRQKRLGRLRYVHETPAVYQVEPFTFSDYWKQTSRWWSGIRQVYDGERLWVDRSGWGLFNHLNLASWIFSAFAPVFWVIFLYAIHDTVAFLPALLYTTIIPLVLATVYAVTTGRVSVYPLLPLFILLGWFDAAHFAARMTGLLKGRTGNRWVSPSRAKEVK